MQSKVTAGLIEHMDKLKSLLAIFDEANTLPETVSLEGCSFKISSTIVQQQAYSALMAEFHRLRNAIDAIKKP